MDDQASRTVASSASVSMPESERRIPSTRCTAPRSSPFANAWETSLRIARSASGAVAASGHLSAQECHRVEACQGKQFAPKEADALVEIHPVHRIEMMDTRRIGRQAWSVRVHARQEEVRRVEEGNPVPGRAHATFVSLVDSGVVAGSDIRRGGARRGCVRTEQPSALPLCPEGEEPFPG